MGTAEYLQLTAIGVQTLIYVLGGVAIVVRASEGNKELRKDLASMQDELKQLAKVITKQAVHDERLTEQSRRMTMLEQRIEDLRRGRGYVSDRDQARMSVDGEYP